jgi:hypothetical protein
VAAKATQQRVYSSVGSSLTGTHTGADDFPGIVTSAARLPTRWLTKTESQAGTVRLGGISQLAGL